MGSGPTLRTSVNRNYLARGPASKPSPRESPRDLVEPVAFICPLFLHHTPLHAPPRVTATLSWVVDEPSGTRATLPRGEATSVEPSAMAEVFHTSCRPLGSREPRWLLGPPRAARAPEEVAFPFYVMASDLNKQVEARGSAPCPADHLTKQ